MASSEIGYRFVRACFLSRSAATIAWKEPRFVSRGCSTSFESKYLTAINCLALQVDFWIDSRAIVVGCSGLNPSSLGRSARSFAYLAWSCYPVITFARDLNLRFIGAAAGISSIGHRVCCFEVSDINLVLELRFAGSTQRLARLEYCLLGAKRIEARFVPTLFALVDQWCFAVVIVHRCHLLTDWSLRTSAFAEFEPMATAEVVVAFLAESGWTIHLG